MRNHSPGEFKSVAFLALGLRAPSRAGALCLLALVMAIATTGVLMAVRHYPVAFDWVYTVLSHLASLNRNPEGGRWISGALLLSCCCLWPLATYLGVAYSYRNRRPVYAIWSLRIGLIAGFILGLEGYFNLRFSLYLYKAHEAVALFAFLGFYLGILAFHAHRIRNDWKCLFSALLVILPLCAIGCAQLYLFFGPHDLGWVNPGWRDLGIPFYLSFAFWQWVAVVSLASSLTHLIISAPSKPRS